MGSFFRELKEGDFIKFSIQGYCEMQDGKICCPAFLSKGKLWIEVLAVNLEGRKKIVIMEEECIRKLTSEEEFAVRMEG